MKLTTLIRTAGILALAFGVSASLSAADSDFGLTFHNSSALEKIVAGEDASLDQLDSLAAWFELSNSLDNGGRLSVAGQAAYEFTDDRAYLFNLDYLRVIGWLPAVVGPSSVLELTAGRFVFSDPSLYIMNHAADGLRARLIYPSVILDLSGAYTGLLLNPKSDIRMSSPDWSEKADEDSNTFGPRRVVANAVLSFPELGKLQNLSLYAVGQFDMRSESDDPKLDTQYLGISIARAYGANVYTDFFFNAELGQIKNPNESARLVAGFLTGFNLKYLREDLKGSRFEFGLLAAPPDMATDLIDGINVGVIGYLPVSQPTLGINVSPQLTGLGLVSLKYSFRPFMGSANAMASRLQAEFGGRGYFRTWPVGVNWISTDPDSDSVYIGTELEGGVQWRIFSDVGVGLNGSAFVPASAVTESDTLWTIRLDVSVSL